MKRRMISLTCVFLLMINMCSAAAVGATTQASDYFGCTDVYATAIGGGEVLVEFDVNATHTMLEVGATEVYIYEQQSNGKYSIVYTFESDDYYSDMMDTNSAFGNGEVTYPGTPGTKYYALVALYARDKYGSEWIYSTTNIVTA